MHEPQYTQSLFLHPHHLPFLKSDAFFLLCLHIFANNPLLLWFFSSVSTHQPIPAATFFSLPLQVQKHNDLLFFLMRCFGPCFGPCLALLFVFTESMAMGILRWRAFELRKLFFFSCWFNGFLLIFVFWDVLTVFSWCLFCIWASGFVALWERW